MVKNYFLFFSIENSMLKKKKENLLNGNWHKLQFAWGPLKFVQHGFAQCIYASWACLAQAEGHQVFVVALCLLRMHLCMQLNYFLGIFHQILKKLLKCKSGMAVSKNSIKKLIPVKTLVAMAKN